MESNTGTSSENVTPSRGWFWWYHRTPLYVRILIALVAGAVCGALLAKTDAGLAFGLAAVAAAAAIPAAARSSR